MADTNSDERFEFTQGLITLLARLKDEHASIKDGWFALNQYYLSFAGRCEDADLRAEMLKLIKMLTDGIPLPPEAESKELDKPIGNVLDISKYIAVVQSGRKISPKDIK